MVKQDIREKFVTISILVLLEMEEYHCSRLSYCHNMVTSPFSKCYNDFCGWWEKFIKKKINKHWQNPFPFFVK